MPRRVFSSSTPGSSILVPGNSFFGNVMNVSMFASLQTMPDFRRSSEYSKPATEAAFPGCGVKGCRLGWRAEPLIAQPPPETTLLRPIRP